MKRFRILSLVILVGLAISITGKAGSLSGPRVKIDLVISHEGTGEVRAVPEAIDRVPENNRRTFNILGKPGTTFKATSWSDCLKQRSEWYATDEATRIADTHRGQRASLSAGERWLAQEH
jgi:hypothetical protein